MLLLPFSAGTSIPKPYALDVYQDSVYWADWLGKTIEKANKFTGEDRKVLLKNVPDVMAIKIFHRTRKQIISPCSDKGGCSHLCLLKQLRNSEHSCACPTGVKLMVSSPGEFADFTLDVVAGGWQNLQWPFELLDHGPSDGHQANFPGCPVSD